jgi:mevalonate pyrophosphate decarboxylase
MEILKEEIDIEKAVSERTTTAQNNRNGSHIILNGEKRSEMYTNRRKVELDKLRNHGEIYLNTENHSKVLPNLKETTKPLEEMREKTQETSKTNISKRKLEKHIKICQ